MRDYGRLKEIMVVIENEMQWVLIMGVSNVLSGGHQKLTRLKY